MFLEEIDRIAKSVRPIMAEKFVKIFCQFDADGLSSAAILVKTFLREKINFQLSIHKQLTEEVIKTLKVGEKDFVILSDFGSGQLDRLRGLYETTQVLVIDHHQPVRLNHLNLFHINPLLHGEEELSSSLIAYLFSKSLNNRNSDTVELAVIGAIGDSQDEKWELKGLARKILEEAQMIGKVSIMKGMRLYGRNSRPIFKSLAYSFDPLIPGISGSEAQAIHFLSELGIEIKRGNEWKKLKDLTIDEQKRLASAIIMERLKINRLDAVDIFGEVYTILNRPEELQDVREFSTLINACGRIGRSDVALRLCLGDYTAIEQSWSVMQTYRKTIGNSLSWIRENQGAMVKKDHATFILGRSRIPETLIGTVSSIVLNSNMVDMTKPIFGLAETENGKVKVSARIDKGIKIDLGKLVKEASASVGGEGGGHPSACGGLIPKGKEQEFINLVNILLGEVHTGQKV